MAKLRNCSAVEAEQPATEQRRTTEVRRRAHLRNGRPVETALRMNEV